MELTEQYQSGRNRREFVRIPSGCEIEAQKILFSAKNDTMMFGEIKNIGAGGICFVSDKKCEHDDMLKVTLKLTNWKKHHPQFLRVYENDIQQPMTAVCQVLRTSAVPDNKWEVAARFVDVYEDDLEGLTRFIDYQAERLGVTV